MTRWNRCQLRPGAGKNSLLKIALHCAPACRVFTSIKCLSAGTLGLCAPAEPQGLRVIHALSSFRTAQQMVWPPLPVPASMLRVSISLSSRSLLCAPRISAGARIFTCRSSKPNASAWSHSKTVTCEIGGLTPMGESVQNPDNSFMSFVDDNHTLSRTEKRAPDAIRQIHRRPRGRRETRR